MLWTIVAIIVVIIIIIVLLKVVFAIIAIGPLAIEQQQQELHTIYNMLAHVPIKI
ncbi:MAG: hypothetical protein ACTHKP_16180 [Nitrososphaeraceae archaeon]|jgi:hypothetical protein